MKTIRRLYLLTSIILATSLLSFNGFSASNNDPNNDDVNLVLTKDDESELLFMLEEEKSARDTYIYLDGLWAINHFANIKNSEQTHMDAI